MPVPVAQELPLTVYKFSFTPYLPPPVGAPTVGAPVQVKSRDPTIMDVGLSAIDRRLDQPYFSLLLWRC